MSKLNAFAAILKFINGSNKGSQYMQGVYDYITAPAKTDNGTLVATHGCSKEHTLEDILTNKIMWHKTHGKQGEHFVLALAPCVGSKSSLEILSVVKEIVATVYPENMAVIAVHTDSKYIHGHVLLDAVNAVTGRKFSQGPADLNRVKQKANNILKKHGFEIITASANEFVDHTDYSKEDGFDFLELDETQFITKSTIEEISSLTGSVSLPYVEKPFESLNYPSFDDYFYGGNNMNYTPYNPQTQDMPAIPSAENVPMVQQVQELPVLDTTAEAVPATCGTTNNYPNTNVLTGPIFRIKATPDAYFAGLNELVKETSAYAQEHQREAGNLALAMQQYGQQTGHPSNITVCQSPIFEVEMFGGIYPPLPEYDDNK